MDIYPVLKTLVVLLLLAGLIWSISLGVRQKGRRDTGSFHRESKPEDPQSHPT